MDEIMEIMEEDFIMHEEIDPEPMGDEDSNEAYPIGKPAQRNFYEDATYSAYCHSQLYL